MSPTSQGALEVERYIGSCLISTSGGRQNLQKPLNACRKQQQQQELGLRNLSNKCQSQFVGNGTWAGGAPLISMAANPRRNNQRTSPNQQHMNHQVLNEQQQLPAHLQNRVPLSRLAVHTQGAPLILSSGRYHNNNNSNRAKIHNAQQMANCGGMMANNNGNVSSNPQSAMRCHPQQRFNKTSAVNDQKKPQTARASEGSSKEGAAAAIVGVNVANIDSLSIASDESSGSNNSENSLPRIIKPRKRRKKDRKPPLVVGVVGNPTAAGAANANSSSDAKAADESIANSAHHFHHSNAIAEQQQQHHQSHPIKSYQNTNSYENARYPSDNYYKGHRRAPNHVRENNYRLHQNNNCPPNGNQASMQQQLSVNSSTQQHEVVDTRQQHQQQQQQQHRSGNYAHRHVQVKVLDDNRNVILPVPVCQAKANYLRNAGVNSNGNASMSGARFMHDLNEPVTLAAAATCHPEAANSAGLDDCSMQGSLCRYCDPATLIWDVSDQNRYSPHFLAQSSLADYNGGGVHRHHHHHHRFSQLPATVLVARPVICQEHPNTIEFFDVENPCLRLRTASTIDRSDGAAILRRSWSDPTSYFSDEIVPNRDVGVIGDRGHQSGESAKGRSSWRGDASSAGCTSPTNQSSSASSSPGAGSPGLAGPLEVSTEIVTSPNGHRDLEIKFYSSSPTTSYTSSPDDSKNAFTFPDDDTNDSEEFSDIWSYHESKLQQDFRTLLQAEE